MPSLVLGTAGHIDHGKSALVKALTGTDPDRLPEEKERGVTIELGFARLELPSGRTMGVVDVPGHEKFVRQMVAGATGIDVVMLVVAADDGVMPQTREHLAIIDLLGISEGVVALTKSDLADPDWLELVRSDVERLLEGTSLEGAPIVPVSAKTGDGLAELLATLDTLAGETKARQANLTMRLPVDRVFTIAGAGTVVTGTMWSGSASRDDAVEVYPAGIKGRVRGVQVHSAAVEKASGGSARRHEPCGSRARRDPPRRRDRDARHAHGHRSLRRALHVPRHAGRRQAVRVRRSRARQPRHAGGARTRAADGRRASGSR